MVVVNKPVSHKQHLHSLHSWQFTGISVAFQGIYFLKSKTTFICVFSSLQCKPPLEVNDLFEDIKDGVKLLALLEVLSGQKLVSIA